MDIIGRNSMLITSGSKRVKKTPFIELTTFPTNSYGSLSETNLKKQGKIFKLSFLKRPLDQKRLCASLIVRKQNWGEN